MSNFSATIPVAQMAAINALLEAGGFGSSNFSVAVVPIGGSAATHAALHCWDIPVFRAALEALKTDFPALKLSDGTGRPNLTETLSADGLAAWVQPEGAHNAKMRGDRVTVGGKTWESLIDYNVWPPGVSGWREIVATGYPPWVQPTGAHDAYKIGDRVAFAGANYESLIGGNVWSPTAYPDGWRRL